MIIATTTTHAGGSGGALLDAAGRLVGLVTSNARHAGGATLPVSALSARLLSEGYYVCHQISKDILTYIH